MLSCARYCTVQLAECAERLDIAFQQVVHESVQVDSLVSRSFHKEALYIFIEIYRDNMENGIASGEMFTPFGTAEIIFRLHIVVFIVGHSEFS